MTRRKVREHLFMLLFCVDFHHRDELEEQVISYMEDMEHASKSIRKEIRDKFYAVVDHLEDIDRQIGGKARGWDIGRLAKADVTALRLAVYELLYDEQVPTGVAINEAVELAKQYGTDKSTGFVNGVLSAVAKEIDGAKGGEDGTCHNGIPD